MLTPTLICVPLVAPAAGSGAFTNPAELAEAALALPATTAAAPIQDDSWSGDAPWHTLRWKFLQVDHQFGDPDGWRFEGQFPVNENIYLHGSQLFFTDFNDDIDADGTVTQLGFGYHSDLGTEELTSDDLFKELEWFGQLDFQSADAGSVEHGFEIAAGVRTIVTDRVEGEVRIGYTEIDESPLHNFMFELRGEYEFTRNVAASVGFQVDDEEFLSVGLRFYPDLQD